METTFSRHLRRLVVPSGRDSRPGLQSLGLETPVGSCFHLLGPTLSVYSHPRGHAVYMLAGRSMCLLNVLHLDELFVADAELECSLNRGDIR